MAQGLKTRVIGVPKTIDGEQRALGLGWVGRGWAGGPARRRRACRVCAAGLVLAPDSAPRSPQPDDAYPTALPRPARRAAGDLKNADVPISFGFDTAVSVPVHACLRWHRSRSASTTKRPPVSAACALLPLPPSAPPQAGQGLLRAHRQHRHRLAVRQEVRAGARRRCPARRRGHRPAQRRRRPCCRRRRRPVRASQLLASHFLIACALLGPAGTTTSSSELRASAGPT